MKLDKLQQLAAKAKITINDTQYEVMDVQEEEGMKQLLVVADEKPHLLAFPATGDEAELFFCTLEQHDDHFHMGDKIEVKSLEC